MLFVFKKPPREQTHGSRWSGALYLVVIHRMSFFLIFVNPSSVPSIFNFFFPKGELFCCPTFKDVFFYVFLF